MRKFTLKRNGNDLHIIMGMHTGNRRRPDLMSFKTLKAQNVLGGI
jgi:hypothetical protein